MEYPTDLKIEASDFEALARDSGRTGIVVGRQSEKQTLYQWIDAAARSQKGALLFLTGPSGSGKTRLVHTARSRALNRGFVVCTGPSNLPAAPMPGL